MRWRSMVRWCMSQRWVDYPPETITVLHHTLVHCQLVLCVAIGIFGVSDGLILFWREGGLGARPLSHLNRYGLCGLRQIWNCSHMVNLETSESLKVTWYPLNFLSMIRVFSSPGCRSHTAHVCAGLANGNLAFYDNHLINVSASCAHAPHGLWGAVPGSHVLCAHRQGVLHNGRVTTNSTIYLASFPGLQWQKLGVEAWERG